METAIEIYSDVNNDLRPQRDYTAYARPKWLRMDHLRVISAKFCGKDSCKFKRGEPIVMEFEVEYTKPLDNICLRYEICDKTDHAIATSVALDIPITAKPGKQRFAVTFYPNCIVSGSYRGFFTFFSRNEFGTNIDVDCVPSLQIETEEENYSRYLEWNPSHWGYVELPIPLVEMNDD